MNNYQDSQPPISPESLLGFPEPVSHRPYQQHYSVSPQMPQEPVLEPQSQEVALSSPLVKSFNPSMKIHGVKAALTIEAVRLEDDFTTICFEAALARNDGSRRFDWQNKLIFRFTRSEMFKYLAVLNRVAPNARFSNHGPNNSKSLLLEWQKDKLFVSVRDTHQEPRAVPVSAADAFLLCMFSMDAFQSNYPRLDSVQIVNTLYAYSRND